MALKLVSQPRYKIERAGFEDATFTESSQEYLVWPKAVEFASARDSVLQSTREAAAFRLEAAGQDHANLYQATRTPAIYFKEGGKWYAAFDDDPRPAKNIILARVEEGYKAHSQGRSWCIPISDKQVRETLRRAEKAGRTLEVKESPLELSVKKEKGKSEFGTATQPIFLEIAEPYAAFLGQMGYNNGFIYLRSPEALEESCKTADNVEVRPVGLGGVVVISSVDADGFFVSFGRARGLVHGAQKNSTGNEGRKV